MIPLQTGVFDAAGAGAIFLVARVIFGGILAFNGLNHFLNAGQMTPYAEAKGVPAASVLVPFTGGQLLVGGLAIILGIYPAVGAGALAVFLPIAAVAMHDFWAVPDEQQQTEMTQFLKNIAMTGGALAFLAVSGVDWPYAVGIGFF
jgi:putative oxidoreductase